MAVQLATKFIDLLYLVLRLNRQVQNHFEPHSNDYLSKMSQTLFPAHKHRILLPNPNGLAATSTENHHSARFFVKFSVSVPALPAPQNVNCGSFHFASG